MKTKRLLFVFLLVASILMGCSKSRPIVADLATSTEMEIGTDPLSYIKAKEENVEITYTIKNSEGKEIKLEDLVPGDYVIVYTLTLNGRSSLIEKAIKMQDTIAPVISGIDAVLALAVNDEIDLSMAVATDAVDKDVRVIADLKTFDSKKAGEYTILLTAIDKSGNKAEKEITVKVVEKEKLEEAKKNCETRNAKEAGRGSC